MGLTYCEVTLKHYATPMKNFLILARVEFLYTAGCVCHTIFSTKKAMFSFSSKTRALFLLVAKSSSAVTYCMYYSSRATNVGHAFFLSRSLAAPFYSLTLNQLVTVSPRAKTVHYIAATGTTPHTATAGYFSHTLLAIFPTVNACQTSPQALMRVNEGRKG